MCSESKLGDYYFLEFPVNFSCTPLPFRFLIFLALVSLVAYPHLSLFVINFLSLCSSCVT